MPSGVGQADQLAKRTFAEETEPITSGDVTWLDPPEIGLHKVQADGYLVVHGRTHIGSLPWPWPAAGAHDQVLLEIKMAGDHVDEEAVERALLRRQARQVQRISETAAGGQQRLGQVPLWMVAPHVPQWISETRLLSPMAAGCYQVGPSGFSFLWIAANELPLADELVPFLVARSGRALDTFVRWAARRKPLPWVLDMVEYLPMSDLAREELLLQRVVAKKDDPEVDARRLHIGHFIAEHMPEVREAIQRKGLEQGLEQGRTEGELRMLLRQFERRLGRSLSPDERARLAERVHALGAEQVSDVVLDHSRDELVAWLA
jgi:hypothetical protein